jgi:2-C-methyl-D-erythritol 2,4-cyclodiphosphate synthase
VSGLRIGSGFDSHRLVEGRPLMLGAVEIPSERGLLGHSDGDCVCHAICDALLGAAGAGDMGAHFPSNEELWRNASGRAFLLEVRRLIEQRGFSIENVDVTAIAQAPRLAPHVAAMRAALATALDLAEERVSVKVKSADHMGALGREEGIAALATVLLRAADGVGEENQRERG